MAPDARLLAFLNSPLEVFAPVAALSDVWTHDPLDVEALHAKARATFRVLLDKATTPSVLGSGGEAQLHEPGRVMLLTGPLGCGKTHLLRAFRNTVHDEGLGYASALQLTTSSTNYGRYLLGNVVDSLSQPHNQTYGPTTSFLQLATALVRNCGDSALQELLLNGAHRDPAEVVLGIEQAIELLRQQPRYQAVDLNLLRVLLSLHRHDHLTTMRVMRYLRCEPLTPTDCQALGGVPPPSGEDAPERVLLQIGELIRSVGRSMVICLDQLEGTLDKTLPPDAFRRAMQMVCNLAGLVRGSVFVVACLSEFYELLRPQLTRAQLDRLEGTPPRQVLAETCTPDEAEQLVDARLTQLFAQSGATVDPASPLFPFQRAEIRQKLGNQRGRVIVAACRKYRERTQTRGRIAEQLLLEDRELPADTFAPVEQRWNDFRARWQQAPSVMDRDVSELLEWALTECDKEDGPQRTAIRRAGDYLGVNLATPTSARRLLLLVSNAGARSAWLSRHIDSIDQAAKDRIAVIARCEAFPLNPATPAGQRLEQFQKRPGGGRCVVLQDADLRTMAALRTFQQESPSHFDAWRRHYRPLLRLPSLQAVLA